MSVASKKHSVIAFALALLLTITGCAHRSFGPVPSETDRASLRSVGIACGKYIPEASFRVPAKGAGQGALIGGGMGFAAPFYGAGGGGPYAIMMAAAIGAVLAPIGAAAGAGSAMPLKEAMISESALRKALADMKIQESLCDRLIVEAREKAVPRLFRLIHEGPAAPSGKTAYGVAAWTGVDSILEEQVTRVGLATTTWGSDPPMELFLDMKLRLVRAGDNADLWIRRTSYRSPVHRYSEWAEDNGRRLKEEFDRAYGEIAERAIEEVFLLVPLP